ncbi:hypothetical protein DFH09DRAFT_1367936 [Mycena vulgaris]|nr:hypothetical protein DFH09DRAFT_1367936 [Mycena vulgaris]
MPFTRRYTSLAPIMTFNNYIWQHRNPPAISRSTVLGYSIRFLISLLTMELILHFIYAVAMRDTKAWVDSTPAQIGMFGFWNLIIVWRKLLIVWRFFRFWAMLDGIEAPENMLHLHPRRRRRYQQRRPQHLTGAFVALWHDITFRQLSWGWLIGLAYRVIGAVVNILMMMAANLIEFVIGVDGTAVCYRGRITILTWRLRFFFGAAHPMFEYREEEKHKGILRRG